MDTVITQKNVNDAAKLGHTSSSSQPGQVSYCYGAFSMTLTG